MRIGVRVKGNVMRRMGVSEARGRVRGSNIVRV